MKEEKKELLFADLCIATVATLATYLVDCVKTAKSIVTAQTKFNDNMPVWAMVVAAFERVYTARLNNSEIPANTSFKEFLKQNAGGEVSGRVLALASLFNTLVLTNGADGKPLLSEKNFRAAKTDHLEKSNAILNAARKQNPTNWTTCPDVTDMLTALSEPGDAGKTLVEIRKRQKGESAETDGAKASAVAAVPLTVAGAVAYLLAALTNLAGRTPDDQYAVCCGFWDIETAMSNLPVAMTEPLETRYLAAKAAGTAAHINLKLLPTPETPAPVKTAPVKTSKLTRKQRRALEHQPAPVEAAPVETPALEMPALVAA